MAQLPYNEVHLQQFEDWLPQNQGYIYMEETLLLIMQIVSGEEMHILEKVVSELGRTHADFLQICSL